MVDVNTDCHVPVMLLHVPGALQTSAPFATSPDPPVGSEACHEITGSPEVMVTDVGQLNPEHDAPLMEKVVMVG